MCLWNLLSANFHKTNFHEIDKWVKIFTKKLLIEANVTNARTSEQDENSRAMNILSATLPVNTMI